MKYFTLVFLSLILLPSCTEMPKDFDQWLVKKTNKEGVYNVNSVFAALCDENEKALISWYIYAYANECEEDVEFSWKCGLLDAMRVKDECAQEHRDFIRSKLGNDPIVAAKLLQCPVMPNDGAIHNLLQYMDIERKSDTITFSMRVSGMNNTEEKHWDIEVKDIYVIEGEGLRKLKN